MRARLVGLAACATLLFAGRAQAQEQSGAAVSTRPAGTLTRRAPYQVIYDALAGSLELQDQRGNVKERWDRFPVVAPLASVPADRPVNIVITNANPLLYDYGVRAEVIRQEEVKSCKNIGGRFLSQGFLLTSAAVGGAVLPSFDASSIPPGFLDINAVFSDAALGTRGATTLSETMLAQQLSAIRAEVNSFADYANALVMLSSTVEDSLALFAAKGESTPLTTLLEQFQQSLESRQPGLSDPAQTPVLIDQRAKAAAPALGTLSTLVRAIQTGSYTGSQSDLAAREALLLDTRVQGGVAQLQASYPTLQQNLLRIERVKSQTTRVFTLGESQGAVRRLVVESQSNSGYERVLRLHEGEVELYTRPRQGLVCELSLGLAWLEPLSSYQFDSGGRLIDANTDDRRVAPVMMIHLSAPVVPPVGLGFGVGIGENSAPDLYLGGTLRLFEPIVVNVGWVWQRTPQLPNGLRVGDVVAPPDPRVLDDLDFRFEPTLFFGVGVGR